MRLTTAGLSLIIVSIVTALFAIYKMNVYLFSAAMALLLILLNEYRTLSRVSSELNKLHFSRGLSKHYGEELDVIEVAIEITNRCNEHIPLLTVKDMPPPYAKPLDDPVFRFSMPPHTSAVLKYRVRIEAPGVHLFDRVQLYVSDALQLFADTVTISARETFTAIPRSVKSATIEKSQWNVIGIKLRGQALYGLYDLANIREYTSSDDIRKILWRVYARLGKLMVREDYGETRARALVVIDLRDYLWSIGTSPNTLAHLQLRLGLSIVDQLLDSGSTVDVALCGETVPKIIENLTKQHRERIYELFMALTPGHGCKTTLVDVVRTTIRRCGGVQRYDAVILVMNPITLALDGPGILRQLVVETSGKLALALPLHDYSEFMTQDELIKLLSRASSMLERAGLGLYLLESPVIAIPTGHRR